MPRPFSSNEGEIRGLLGKRLNSRSGRTKDTKGNRLSMLSFAGLLATPKVIEEKHAEHDDGVQSNDSTHGVPGGAPATGSSGDGPDDANTRQEDKKLAGPANQRLKRSPSMSKRLSMILRVGSPRTQTFFDGSLGKDAEEDAIPEARLPRRRLSALRARGLEPPARDLSALERERDARLPVLQPVGEDPEGEASAARRIREEWRARHGALQVDTGAASGTGVAVTVTPVDPVDPCAVPLPPSPGPSRRRGSAASSERAPGLETDSRSSLASSSPRSEASWRARERGAPGVLESPVEGSVVLPPLAEEDVGAEESVQEQSGSAQGKDGAARWTADAAPRESAAPRADRANRRLSLFGWPTRAKEGGSASKRRSGTWDLPRGATWEAGRSAGGREPPSTRLPVAPTMHDVKTISTKMESIEDEETRRMTEVAFM
ncbi:hypothetical protein HDZ31DRAFT_71842 [Schizophyllum fasciatum]